MNIQPKTEPVSPLTNHVILDRDEDETYLMERPHNFEDKTISDLVEVLRVAYLPKTFDTVEAVLVSRDDGLRDKIQVLQQNVEMVKQELEEEKLARLKQAEEGKKLEQRYTTLLKELKRSGLAVDRDTIEVLRKTNTKLKEMWEREKREVKKYEAMLEEAEISRLADMDVMEEMKMMKKKLEEKREEDGNELQVLKLKNSELSARLA